VLQPRHGSTQQYFVVGKMSWFGFGLVWFVMFAVLSVTVSGMKSI
jgi:hypothetical protein